MSSSAFPDPAPPAPSRLAVHATLFVTGAATLALELIASRVLTPYVGGGLVVWTAILSITLLALALGYHLGSRWSAGDARALFVRIPALAAIVLGLTGALSPALLPQLTLGGGVSAAFIGVVFVLAPALVLLSAMGPLGIALIRTGEGDSGAGEVFAVSTVGSVAGVFVAAFALLPFMAPAATFAAIALCLGLVALAAAWRLRALRRLLGFLPAIVAAALLSAAATLNAPEAIAVGPYRIAHVATERGAHATIIVADLTENGREGAARIYFEENEMQSAIGIGVSGHPLRYAALTSALVAATTPAGGRVLVLGLAGGVIASDLSRQGYAVTAVDINPQAAEVARRWFNLAPQVETLVADARLHLERCPQQADAIFLDVYSGLEIPEHLVTRETFAAARACLAPGGVIIVNAVVPPLESRPSRRLVAALAQGTGTMPNVYDEDPRDPRRRNRILIVRPDHDGAPVLALEDYPSGFLTRERRSIAPAPIAPALLAGVAPLSDASNDFALAMAIAAPTGASLPLPAQWF